MSELSLHLQLAFCQETAAAALRNFVKILKRVA